MSLRVIGAGLPRTGTTSLKGALEQLLDGRCYHMRELNDRFADDEALWLRALDGDSDALTTVLDGWAAAVDWPASLLWRELAEQHPQALVILSRRSSFEEWWTSVDATVWANIRMVEPGSSYEPLTTKMLDKADLGAAWDTPEAAAALYDRVIAEVTETIHPSRLLVWEPGDGWEPLCKALDVPVPDEPFAHHNATAEFRRRSNL